MLMEFILMSRKTRGHSLKSYSNVLFYFNKRTAVLQQELSYSQKIARQLRTEYVQGI